MSIDTNVNNIDEEITARSKANLLEQITQADRDFATPFATRSY